MFILDTDDVNELGRKLVQKVWEMYKKKGP